MLQLFPLLETIFEIRRNPVFLKTNFFMPVEIRRNPIFKK